LDRLQDHGRRGSTRIITKRSRKNEEKNLDILGSSYYSYSGSDSGARNLVSVCTGILAGFHQPGAGNSEHDCLLGTHRGDHRRVVCVGHAAAAGLQIAGRNSC